MKKIILIIWIMILLPILSGCAERVTISEVTTPDVIVSESYYRNYGESEGVSRFIDKEAGVVCWMSRVNYGYSISCLPIKDTLLNGK